jgi:pimeloyl-ACP methyl ester carboxylesterase
MPDRAERMTRGYIYYFDGAGGGGLMNWAGGVKQGLLEAGYNGAGEVVKWNTGMGVVADQDSSAEYKKSKAAEAAQSIQQYAKQYPGAPVTLIGLSAGTAVTVFTLEALPVTCPVENVILLGASVSDDHDLTQALRRVRNRMYVFTSERDAVLAFAVTMAGTADRSVGSLAAGLRGFQMPRRASAETRTLYTKVVNIQWRAEFMAAGDFGGHTDTVKAPFVQEYVAPLIMTGMARSVPQAILLPSGKVHNPDYDRWAAFSPGAWTTFEGYQVVKGVRQQLRMKAKLISKHEDRLVVERTYVMKGPGSEETSRVQQFLVQAEIKPDEHPLSSPNAKITEGPAQKFTIGGNVLECRVRTVQASGEFPEYGRDVWATVARNNAVPGGMVKVWLKSSKDGQPYEVNGTVVAYGTR